MQRDRRNDLSIHRTVGPEGWRLRHAHIVRGMIGLAVVVILAAMLPNPARAGVDLGQFCWRLDPFVDTLRLSITAAIGAAPLFELHSRVRATATAGQQAAGGVGPAAYQLLGAGTATDSLTQPGSIDLGLEAVHNTTFFGGESQLQFLRRDQQPVYPRWLLDAAVPRDHPVHGPRDPDLPDPVSGTELRARRSHATHEGH
jgi:hypothetical protein